MSSPTYSSLLQVTWLTVCLVLRQVVGCRGQYGQYPGSLYGGSHVGTLPGTVPIQQVPAPYGGNVYQRPGYTSGYGYGYSNTNLRNRETEEEALDNAQKNAMGPLNSVMASLPMRPDILPLVSLNLPTLMAHQGREAINEESGQSVPCTTNCSKGRSSAENVTTKTLSHKSPEEHHQEITTSSPDQLTNRQPPQTSSFCCPCSSGYYSWLYGGFPFYDYLQLSYPKSTGYGYTYPKSTGYGYTYPKSTGYGYNYPYSLPDPPSKENPNSKTARTFWLPWLRPSGSQVQPAAGNTNSFHYVDPNYYSRMYYGTRY